MHGAGRCKQYSGSMWAAGERFSLLHRCIASAKTDWVGEIAVITQKPPADGYCTHGYIIITPAGRTQYGKTFCAILTIASPRRSFGSISLRTGRNYPSYIKSFMVYGVIKGGWVDDLTVLIYQNRHKYRFHQTGQTKEIISVWWSHSVSWNCSTSSSCFCFKASRPTHYQFGNQR